jgi:hypothetical protein
VTLHALNREAPAEGAATADLDRVPRGLLAGRLADDAPVDTLATGLEQLDDALVPSTDGPSSSLVMRKARVRDDPVIPRRTT